MASKLKLNIALRLSLRERWFCLKLLGRKKGLLDDLGHGLSTSTMIILTVPDLTRSVL
jgi:hypothetical protein